MTKECQRVLKEGGYFVSISFGQPNTRELHLKRPHLKFETQTAKIQSPAGKGPAANWLYIGKKLVGADEVSSQKWDETMEQVRQEEAEQGYHSDSSQDEMDEESKEDLYSKPLEIDMELVKKKAAELLGVPVSELPVEKAESEA